MEIDDEVRARAHACVADYLASDQVDASLQRAASYVTHDDDYWYMRKSYFRTPLAAMLAAVERLHLVTLMKHEKVWSVLFYHWEPLCLYLALTCFDLLGQPTAGWRSPRQWLSTLRSQGLPPELTAALQQLEDPVEIADLLLAKYDAMYGVRSSFYRFLRDVLPTSARADLLESIKIEEWPLPLSGTGQRVLDDDEKERYLFEMRNSYTHRAFFIGGTGYPRPEFLDWSEVWAIREQHVVGDHMRQISCRDWPDAVIRAARKGLASYMTALPERAEA